MSEVALYAEKDAHQKASKHLPTEQDLHVNTKISGNEVLVKMMADPALKEQFSKLKPELNADKELLRKIYYTLAERTEYKSYINQSARDKADEKKIIEFILNDLLLANEAFVAHIEEIFTNWDDDGEMAVQLLSGYMQKPGSINFKQMMSADKEQFAKNLLQAVLEKGEHLQSTSPPATSSIPKSPTPSNSKSSSSTLCHSAKNPSSYETDRLEEFAPIKNAPGVDSAESSKDLESTRAARWLESVGVKIPRHSNGTVNALIELSPLTAIAPEDLKSKASSIKIDPGARVTL